MLRATGRELPERRASTQIGLPTMSLRQKLQIETNADHRALDALVARLGCFDDLDGYGRWLLGMHDFHESVRSSLAACEAENSDNLRCLERVRRLSRDLDDLGVAKRKAFARPRIEIADEAAMLGVLYVSEGASLGARILVGRATALGCNAEHGGRYLAAEAASFSAWRAVLGRLEGAKFGVAATQRAVRAARNTFALATHVIEGTGGYRGGEPREVLHGRHHG